MAIYSVFSHKKMVIFHSYVNVYRRVYPNWSSNLSIPEIDNFHVIFEVKKPGFQWRSSLKPVQWLESSGDQGQVSRYEALFGSGHGPSGVQCWSVRLLCTEPDGLEVSREDEELPWKWKPGHGASQNIGNIMEWGNVPHCHLWWPEGQGDFPRKST